MHVRINRSACSFRLWSSHVDNLYLVRHGQEAPDSYDSLSPLDWNKPVSGNRAQSIAAAVRDNAAPTANCS